MMTDTTEKREALEIRPQNEYPSLIRNMAKPNMVSTESDVLSRVKAFLPELEQANQTLLDKMKTQPASDFDIENVNESQNHIEMNIYAGLLEEKESKVEGTKSAQVLLEEILGNASSSSNEDSGDEDESMDTNKTGKP
eukprot:m.171827 g.171827  ORF g.171827 m.171827 type:complete len:138 (-) comp15357_c0_seq5:2001-2414(-)